MKPPLTHLQLLVVRRLRLKRRRLLEGFQESLSKGLISRGLQGIIVDILVLGSHGVLDVYLYRFDLS